MDILKKIVSHKREEVAFRKEQVRISELENSALFDRNGKSLQGLLQNELGIIAEYKRKSPSEGVINDAVQVQTVIKEYAQNGAAGMSILTDENFFGGSLEDLRLGRQITEKPLLRKDFVIDEYQLLEAKANGADVILLIAACLENNRAKELAQFARSLSLEVLLEVHNEEELAFVNEHVNIVGVNNRNLNDFSVSLETSKQLAPKISTEFARISESGISNASSIVELQKLGFDGFLIGSHFMRQEEPAAALDALLTEVNVLQHG